MPESEPKRKMKAFRLPEDLAEKFEKLAKEQNRPEQECGEEAIKCWVDGRRKADKTSETMRKIQNKYEGKKCLKCGASIPVSATCWWARDVGVVCEDCHSKVEIEGLSDPILAKKYRVKRELTRTISALRKEADGFADQNIKLSQRINLYALAERHEELDKKKVDLLLLLEKYLHEGIGSPEEKELLQKFSEEYNNIEQLQEIIRNEIERRLFIPSTSKKEKKPSYAT